MAQKIHCSNDCINAAHHGNASKPPRSLALLLNVNVCVISAVMALA
jgi:hypothetical protein